MVFYLYNAYLLAVAVYVRLCVCSRDYMCVIGSRTGTRTGVDVCTWAQPGCKMAFNPFVVTVATDLLRGDGKHKTCQDPKSLTQDREHPDSAARCRFNGDNFFSLPPPRSVAKERRFNNIVNHQDVMIAFGAEKKQNVISVCLMQQPPPPNLTDKICDEHMLILCTFHFLLKADCSFHICSSLIQGYNHPHPSIFSPIHFRMNVSFPFF